MKTSLPLLGLFLLLTMALPTAGRAQDTTSSIAPAPPRWLWVGNLPGGTVKVHVQRIISVSFSRYTVEGGFRVLELVIDTYGNNSIRIYAVENAAEASGPNGMGKTAIASLQDKAEAAANRAAAAAGAGDTLTDLTSTMVLKKYPEATHAHTIEYRVAKPKEVYDIYRSVDSAWETGQGGTYTTESGPLVIQ